MGLSGEDIPLEARIVAVAHFFDAMTTARVYQAASTVEQAVNEIVAGIGNRYDPKVVEAFLSIRERLESIDL